MSARGMHVSRFMECIGNETKERRHRIFRTMDRELKMNVNAEFLRDKLRGGAEIRRKACVQKIHWQTMKRDKWHARAPVHAKGRHKTTKRMGADKQASKSLFPVAAAAHSIPELQQAKTNQEGRQTWANGKLFFTDNRNRRRGRQGRGHQGKLDNKTGRMPVGQEGTVRGVLLAADR